MDNPNNFVSNCINTFFNNKLNQKYIKKYAKMKTEIALLCHASLIVIKVCTNLYKTINYDCKVNFRTFKISNHFFVKDVTPFTLRANVVYFSKGLVIRPTLTLAS